VCAILAGDYLFADRDGVVVILQNLAEEVTAKTEEVMRRESNVRKSILKGVDPQKACLKYGKF